MSNKVNNLLNRHKTREDDGAFYNFAQVRQITENYENLVSSYQNKNSWIIQSLIQNLENLKLILESQERTFYGELGLSGPEAIKILQEKVDIWNNSGASVLLNDKFIMQVSQLIQVEIDQNTLIGALQTILNNPTEQEEISDILIEEDIQIWQLLNEVFSKEGKGRYASGKKSSINASLEISKNNGTFIVTQKEGAKLSGNLSRKLAKDINDYSNKQIIDVTPKDWDNISRQIYYLFKSHISDTEILHCLNYELHNRKKDDYNRMGEFIITKGWLGELYWNACLSYLFGQKGISTPVGRRLNNRKKQLSVDIILRSCGFQVKSWKITEGKHITEYHRRLGNFLETRADLADSLVGKIIAQMFGAISYNKPTEEPEYRSDNFPEYEQYYHSRVLPKASQIEALEEIFRTRLNKIIEIDNGGKLDEGVLNKESEFYNTFWLINDKVIPSSIIINEMIEELKTNSKNQAVVFDIVKLTDEGKSVWPNLLNATSKGMANRWTMDYEIIFDLDYLLQKVANSITKGT